MPAESPTLGFEVILIAPNVSEQMGGEAIKALQIYLELERQGVRVHQITHERVKGELDTSYPWMSVSYIPDTLTEKLLHRAKLSEQFLNYVFLRSAVRRVQTLLQQSANAVVHFTSPVSPVLPYPPVSGARVVIGPINGNIHYPPAFRPREGLATRVRRWLHAPVQRLSRLSSGKIGAAALLVAGGERTYASLRLSGCTDAQFVDSIDSGVTNALAELPRIVHTGQNLRFYYSGRLVDYKGVDLILHALTRTRHPIHFDVLGAGAELESLKSLVVALHLEDRVQFLGWVPLADLSQTLREYRAFVFPSLAEANGIVVQEAMVQGLPVIACNWGGPSLLVTPETGILIEPISEEFVIDELAAAMDLLAENGVLAESMSLNARNRAIEKGFLWSGVISDWRKVYRSLTPTSDSIHV